MGDGVSRDCQCERCVGQPAEVSQAYRKAEAITNNLYLQTMIARNLIEARAWEADLCAEDFRPCQIDNTHLLERAAHLRKIAKDLK